jgi:hypothetical protein
MGGRTNGFGGKAINLIFKLTYKLRELQMNSSTHTKTKNLQQESCVKQQDQATRERTFQMVDQQ